MKIFVLILLSLLCYVTCEKSFTNTTQYITGGPNSVINEVPTESRQPPVKQSPIKKSQEIYNHYISVRLRIEDVPFGNGHKCGAALLKPTKVITTAYCLIDTTQLDLSTFLPPEDFITVAVKNNRRKANESLIRNVHLYYVHPDFNSTTLSNNIAILITAPFPFDTSKLPKFGYLNKGMKCAIGGFGVSAFGSTPSDEFRSAEVMLLDKKVCKRIFDMKNLTGFLCAGDPNGNNNDICYADVGGPLICNNSLIGLITLGLDCATPESPVLYTDVKHFSNWIESILSGEIRKRSKASITNCKINFLFSILFSYILSIKK